MHQKSTPIHPNSVCGYCGAPFVSNLTGKDKHGERKYRKFCSRECSLRGKFGRTSALDTPHDLGNGTAIVFLGDRVTTLIDAEDIPIVRKYGWSLSNHHRRPDYAATSIGGHRLYLHRLVMNAKPGEMVDHRNHNTLDNRKENLRIATPSQNVAHQQVRKGTQYKGVQLRVDGKKWRARIKVRGKEIHLGSFDSPEAAAQAYDKAAIIHFGKFALLNFPSG